ncbi:hypothetical protein A5733_00125 [Mycobacterium sp. NS-7484]|nr:hypothetical protein A5733_00125 [Mycobacterium sp. NS-7484]
MVRTLPAAWGPPRATLLRSTAYSGGSGADTALFMLGCWAMAGRTLVVIVGLRRPTRTAPMMQLRGTR